MFASCVQAVYLMFRTSGMFARSVQAVMRIIASAVQAVYLIVLYKRMFDSSVQAVCVLDLYKPYVC